MSSRQHAYEVTIEWTGNRGQGTAEYASYGRSHEITARGKPTLLASSDPSFRGEADRYNPEDLLVASLSSCHLLSYLHLCATSGIVVTGYVDAATGRMAEAPDIGGRFTEVTLHPIVTIASGDAALAHALHEKAHHLCFIANSVNFPVHCEPKIVTG